MVAAVGFERTAAVTSHPNDDDRTEHLVPTRRASVRLHLATRWASLAPVALIGIALAYFLYALQPTMPATSREPKATPTPVGTPEDVEEPSSQDALPRSDDLQPVAAWLARRFEVVPPRPPWSLTRIETDSRIASIVIELPRSDAVSFRTQRYTQQVVSLKKIGCPGLHEPVWALLDSRHEIWIRAQTDGAEWLASPCR